MKKLIKYFLEGLLIFVPLAGSVYVIYTVFTKIDGMLGIPIPGLGFAITITVITLCGFLASNLFTKGYVKLVEKIFEKLPLVKLIYTSLKDLLGAFVGDKKSFDKPVMVTLDETTGAKALGFVTKEDLDFLGIKGHVAVYMPQSYNFAGNLMLFPASKVTPIKAESSDVMAFLISGGVSSPKKDA
ncbi:MAG: DUF502 domain-containing protein [Deltaproteobacteria bacterium]|nr:DUF502 domain-containing protein [Deltaproteobacteria bacterium]